MTRHERWSGTGWVALLLVPVAITRSACTGEEDRPATVSSTPTPTSSFTDFDGLADEYQSATQGLAGSLPDGVEFPPHRRANGKLMVTSRKARAKLPRLSSGAVPGRQRTCPPQIRTYGTMRKRLSTGWRNGAHCARFGSTLTLNRARFG